MSMTAYERVKAMVEGREVDRPGVAAWKHVFLDDRYALEHAMRTTAFQEMGGWDFIKVMCANIHMEAAFGAKIWWSPNESDRTHSLARVAKSPRALRDIKVVDWAPLEKEVEVAKRLVDRYKGKVPVIATVDLPASYIKSLYCGFADPEVYTHLIRYYQDDFQEGLKIVTDVVLKYIDMFAKAGVDGFFLPTNIAIDKYMTEDEYKEYCLPAAKTAAQAAADCGAWFNMVHIHGDGTVFWDLLVNNLPVQAVNWHSVTSCVDLAEAAKRTDKILIGGVDHMRDFQLPERDQIRERISQRVDEAIRSVPANRLIIAPGCCPIPPSIPDTTLNILKQAVDARYAK